VNRRGEEVMSDEERNSEFTYLFTWIVWRASSWGSKPQAIPKIWKSLKRLGCTLPTALAVSGFWIASGFKLGAAHTGRK